MSAGTIDQVDEATKDVGLKEGKNIRGFSIADLVLRGFAAIGAFGSAIAMATTNETTLSFSIQFIFRAKYNDLPTFTFFVIANSIVCGYLVLSLPLSVFHFIRSEAKITRIVLAIFDTVMLVLLTAGASSATAIVCLAHEGNASANWAPICQQLNNFCEQSSGSLIGSFISIIMISLIIIASSVANSRRR